jgi:hypothetical protein
MLIFGEHTRSLHVTFLALQISMLIRENKLKLFLYMLLN